MRTTSYKIFFICCLIFSGTKYFAQDPKLDFHNLKPILFKTEKPLLFFSSIPQPSLQTDLSFAKAFHATKRPMFCKMEDNLHKRLNVWIVLRAGSDADYRKLIVTEK
jgi:hypothetical protein